MDEPVVEEIPYHVEMRPFGWVVWYDEPVTVHTGDIVEYRGLTFENGKPEYESVCIIRARGQEEDQEDDKQMAGIQTKPEPYCPICGAKMILRRPQPNQDWEPFWGCPQYPDCRGTRNISDDGKPEED